MSYGLQKGHARIAEGVIAKVCQHSASSASTSWQGKGIIRRQLPELPGEVPGQQPSVRMTAWWGDCITKDESVCHRLLSTAKP